jgi:transposase
LEAVIETYVATAEPAGSRTIAKRFGLALSAATIRNTMSDLEEKGYLYHPHTSAGRVPTDLAYRVYVNSLMRLSQVSVSESDQIRHELGNRNALDQILERAAQVLGVLTKELGVAVGPTLERAVLERLELWQAASQRLLLVLTLKSGVVRTIFVEVPAELAADAVAQVAEVLNERLAGLTLRDIRATLPARLRDAAPAAGASELLNIFIQEADDLFDGIPRRGRRGAGQRPAARRPARICHQGATAGPDGGDRAARAVARGTQHAVGPGPHDHDRQRAPGSDPRPVHLGDGFIPAGRAGGRDRRDGADAHAVRQDRGARGSYESPGG